MTLQQMRYVLYTAQYGSISGAAQKLFVSQPTVSGEIRKLEKELGIRIFDRGKSGIVITDEGEEFINYIRSIIEQTEFIENKYNNKGEERKTFSVAGHHSAIISEAFLKLIKTFGTEAYRLQILEVKTKEILDFVVNGQCDMGVLIKDRENRVLDTELKLRGIEKNVLCTRKPHVYLHKSHPLAGKKTISTDDLLDYPFMVFYQGDYSWQYYSEEVLGGILNKQIIVLTDTRTESVISANTNAYTIGTGVTGSAIRDTVAIPVETANEIEVVWIKREGKAVTPVMEKYLDFLKKEIAISM